MSKSIRSSQLLSPFGIGQIVNFPDQVSVMICGLDDWEHNIAVRSLHADVHNTMDENLLRINERRLQSLLEVEYFIVPFQYKNKGVNSKLNIPAVRFPQWHYCSNTRCGRMTKVELTFSPNLRRCPDCNYRMLPVRFVAVCNKGHIQDVPFKEWVHRGNINEGEHILRFHTGTGSGDLSSIIITCSCGLSRSLAGLMNVSKNENTGIAFNSALGLIGREQVAINFNQDNPLTIHNNPDGQFCCGHRPWLGLQGINEPEVCNDHLQVLVKGGSNIHYSNIISALYLPEFTENLLHPVVVRIIERVGINQLRQYYDLDRDNLIMLRIGIENLAGINNNNITEILGLLVNELQGEEENIVLSVGEENLRFEEYKYILNGRNSENSDFKAVVKSFENYNDSAFLSQYFEKVVLVEKLKETRVFRGFSRINSLNRVPASMLSINKKNWLPGYRVSGEGIFLQFKSDRLTEWLHGIGPNVTKLLERYHSSMADKNNFYINNPRQLNPVFILMHTFSHLLIKRLCHSCGYGSSSLKERIYFSTNQNSMMNGILIYTSSGDTEGSLGGLVRQGQEKYLSSLIREAIEEARWCSADPVCSDIGHSVGQGPGNLNGSACHNCCLVPETSCEEYNTLLDRSTIVGSWAGSNGYFID